MNGYILDLNGGANGIKRDDLPVLLKALGYMFLYGKNITVFNASATTGSGSLIGVAVGAPLTIDFGDFYLASDTDNFGSQILTCPKISFELDFSLSNLTGLDVPKSSFGDFTKYYLGLQTWYDTSMQSVREFVDKPYPVKGYYAVATGSSDIPKDLDNFIRINAYIENAAGSAAEVAPIYFGKLNSSKTDFYDPLKDSFNVIIDTKSV